ncbi:TLDc domain-containing protein [Entamoeba marina]
MKKHEYKNVIESEPIKTTHETKFQQKQVRTDQLKLIKVPKVDNDDGIEMTLLSSSIESLCKWSGKQHYNTIFDSKIDGDGKGIIEQRVMNKKNLYFISFDNENNVFGGYVSELINKKDEMEKFGRDSYSDIFVCKIGSNESYCDYHSFEYNGEQQPLREKYRPTHFTIKRVLVLEMIN